MRELMANDRARHNILPLSKFGLMNYPPAGAAGTRYYLPVKIARLVMVKVLFLSSLLFTDLLESKIHYLVYKLKIKNSHYTCPTPFVAAYVKSGVFSLKMKWRCKYTFQLKVIPNQSLAYLEYKFYDAEP